MIEFGALPVLSSVNVGSQGVLNGLEFKPLGLQLAVFQFPFPINSTEELDLANRDGVCKLVRAGLLHPAKT